MAAVSETIVREYFELHGFFVRQQRKYISPSRQEDEEIDFCVVNLHARPAASPLPLILTSAHLENIAQAVVGVKGWHCDVFSHSLLASAPEIFRFLEPSALQRATRAFGTVRPFSKILVVPALPSGEEARQQSLDLLRSKGIDAVIPFRTILSDLIAKTETNRNYQKSDLLQIIRILKNYEFLREPQMELFKVKRRGPRKKGPAAPSAAPNEPIAGGTPGTEPSLPQERDGPAEKA